MNPPVIRWYPDNQSGASVVPVEYWDSGIVDAGSFSRVEDPTAEDNPLLPSTFTIWNNRKDTAQGTGATAVNRATNVKLTTLSLVRYIATDPEVIAGTKQVGDINVAKSYLPEGKVAAATEGASDNQRQATVQAIFWETTKKNSDNSLGQWGSYNDAGEWVGWDSTESDPNKKWKVYNADGTYKRAALAGEVGWRKIYGDTRAALVVAAGQVGAGTAEDPKVHDALAGDVNTGSIATNTANYSRVRFRLGVHPLASAGKVEWFTRVSYNYQGI